MKTEIIGHRNIAVSRLVSVRVTESGKTSAAAIRCTRTNGRTRASDVLAVGNPKTQSEKKLDAWKEGVS